MYPHLIRIWQSSTIFYAWNYFPAFSLYHRCLITISNMSSFVIFKKLFDCLLIKNRISSRAIVIVSDSGHFGRVRPCPESNYRRRAALPPRRPGGRKDDKGLVAAFMRRFTVRLLKFAYQCRGSADMSTWRFAQTARNNVIHTYAAGFWIRPSPLRAVRGAPPSFVPLIPANRVTIVLATLDRLDFFESWSESVLEVCKVSLWLSENDIWRIYFDMSL